MTKAAHRINIIAIILTGVVAWALSSCSGRGGNFTITGKFRHLNSADLYIYSPDNAIDGIDTIHVMGGRIAYEKPCKQEGTIVVIFPNFSEQPIFVKPGKKVEISADASHLKEMKVTGTKANELMNDFRELVQDATPPEIKKLARLFILDHPESVVGNYLLSKYFLQTALPDYKTADSLIRVMQASQQENTYLKRLGKTVAALKNTGSNSKLPAIKAKDINGKNISFAELAKAPHAVIYTWASWNYDGQDLQRQLHRHQKVSDGKLKVIGISLDASKFDCRQVVRRDSITSPVICDGDMFEGKTFRELGFSSIPDNIVLEKGKIVARGLTTREVMERIK